MDINSNRSQLTGKRRCCEDRENIPDYGEVYVPPHKVRKPGSRTRVDETLKPLLSRDVIVGEMDFVGEASSHILGFEDWSEDDYLALTQAFDISYIERVGKETLYFDCINQGYTNLVQGFLKDLNFDVNFVDECTGGTALRLAVSRGDLSLVQAMIESDRIDVNAVNPNRRTGPIHFAVLNGDLEMLSLLMEAPGVDLDARENSGMTALMLAAISGKYDMADKLMASGGLNVNAQDKEGRTALYFAASSGDARLVQSLLDDPRVDPNILTHKGGSAALRAMSAGHEEIAALFPERLYLDARKSSLLMQLQLLFQIDVGLMPEGFPSGSSNQFAFTQLCKSWTLLRSCAFKASFWEAQSSQLDLYFAPLIYDWEDLNNRITAESTANKITNGQHCSIPSGTPGHFISISVWGDWIAVGNRGELINEDESFEDLNEPGIYFYHIPHLRVHLDEDFIERLLFSEQDALQEIQCMESSQVLYFERSDQKRGNCTYANGKLDFEAHMLFFAAEQLDIRLENITDDQWLELLNTVELLYHDFATLGRVQLLNECINCPDFDKTLIHAAYKELEDTVLNKGRGDEHGCFRLLSVLNEKGEEIPILDQVHLEAL